MLTMAERVAGKRVLKNRLARFVLAMTTRDAIVDFALLIGPSRQSVTSGVVPVLTAGPSKQVNLHDDKGFLLVSVSGRYRSSVY